MIESLLETVEAQQADLTGKQMYFLLIHEMRLLIDQVKFLSVTLRQVGGPDRTIDRG